MSGRHMGGGEPPARDGPHDVLLSDRRAKGGCCSAWLPKRPHIIAHGAAAA
jgi:hypothetical protein